MRRREWIESQMEILHGDSTVRRYLHKVWMERRHGILEHAKRGCRSSVELDDRMVPCGSMGPEREMLLCDRCHPNLLEIEEGA